MTDVFQWNAKKTGEIFLDMSENRGFCLLVDIPEQADVGPTYYIVPTSVVDKWLRDDFQVWATTPGARKQQRDAANTQRLFYVDGDNNKLAHGYKEKLAPYKGAWDRLAPREHAIGQLDSLAREAGLDLMELIGSGMSGEQLLDHVVEARKRAKGPAKT